LLTLLELIGAGLHDEKTRGAGTDMTASETGSVAWPGQFPRGGSTVSVLVATAIVVADMVGVGVFTSLGFQVKDIPSGFSILL
jgi:APA family basic amino acid/polyamine antiporter